MDEIRQWLTENREVEFQAFSKKLIPTGKELIGVRIPKLRAYAKGLAKQYGLQATERCGEDTFEQVLLQGLIIGACTKEDPQMIIDALDRYVDKIDNWCTCDVVCSSLKIVKRYPALFRNVIERYRTVDDTFMQRFCIVLLMDYYLDDDSAENALQTIVAMPRRDYYVSMAKAWALATAFVKQRELTMPYLSEDQLGPWVYRKTLQKMLESYRIEEEDKIWIRAWRDKASPAGQLEGEARREKQR